MFEKYPLIVSRYEELSEAIVQPDIIADTARYQAYLKERAALEEQVTAWQSYQSLLRHREQAQEMLSDPDLHEMAAEELQSLAAQIAEAEQQLRILLLPRDPDDDHSIIMEIRGGAGGEESCLFAAELMRMYIRYAERHHFRVEPISTTETELGGIKEAVFSACRLRSPTAKSSPRPAQWLCCRKRRTSNCRLTRRICGLTCTARRVTAGSA